MRTRRQQRNRDRLAAAHEVGHAVVAYALGARCVRIDIFDTAACAGYCVVLDMPTLNTLARLTYDVAGEAAEVAFNAPDASRCGQPPMHLDAGPAGPSDEEAIAAMLDQLATQAINGGLHDDDAIALRGLAYAKAIAILDDNRPAAVELVDRLVWSRELDAVTIASVIGRPAIVDAILRLPPGPVTDARLIRTARALYARYCNKCTADAVPQTAKPPTPHSPASASWTVSTSATNLGTRLRSSHSLTATLQGIGGGRGRTWGGVR
jgi:hypothetical protein